MERRRAVAIATATATTTLAAVAAIAANFGLLGFGQAASSPVGNLDAGRVAQVIEPPPASSSAPGTDPNVAVRYEDIYLPAPTVAPARPTGASSPATDSGAVTGGDGGMPTAYDGAEDEHSDDHEEHEEHGFEEDD